MHSINILSLAPSACNWLANSRHPRILHVFEHGCNLINERWKVLSIVTPQIGNGPFNLVLEDDVLFSDHLNIKSSVSILDNQILLANLTINTTTAELWNPRPDWEKLYANRNHITKLLLTNYQKSGLDTGFATNAQPYSTTNLQSLVSSLSTALANADLPSSLTAAQKLAGLGMGLTPAGDDFILGAILAAWIIHPPEMARVLAKEVTDVAAPLTTSLSAAWLRSAGRGEAGVLWHNFFEDLIAADANAIQESLDKILSVGETSGADALAGFISLFMSGSVEVRILDG